MTLQEAHKIWADLAPLKRRVGPTSIAYRRVLLGIEEMRSFLEKERWDGDCCGGAHHTFILKNGLRHQTPRSDNEVCARERAWRAYCHIRDGKK